MAVNTTNSRPESGADPTSLDTLSALINGDRAFRSMRDRWWLLVLVPLAAMALVLLMSRFEPYRTTVQATVLLPGDTEIPGNAERPELMMLDDLPTLIRSRVFAEGVLEALPGRGYTVEEVQSALEGSRYSRIVTVTVSGGSSEKVSDIAEAVDRQLASLVNAYLIPEEGQQATVRVINPPGQPVRSNENQVLQLLLAGVSGIVLASVIATIIGPRSMEIQSPSGA